MKTDPFSIFCYAPTDDFSDLDQRYFAFQKQHHPDLGGDVEFSSQYNEAYAILRDPIKRSEAWLGTCLDYENSAVVMDEAFFELLENDLAHLVSEFAIQMQAKDFCAASKILVAMKMMRDL